MLNIAMTIVGNEPMHATWSLVCHCTVPVKNENGQTITEFDQQRDRNLYKIWNRLCSGTYFPPPVREKRIPKDNGKERVLGIRTVSDRIAQGAVK